MKKYSMSLLILLSTFTLFTGVLFGQNEKPWQIQKGFINGGGGNNLMYVQLNTYFKNGWVALAGYDEGYIESRNLPKDYNSGITIDVTDPMHDRDIYKTFSIGMGRILTKKPKWAWLITTAELSFGKYEERHFYKKIGYYYPNRLINTNYRQRYAYYTSSVEPENIIGLKTGIKGHIKISKFIGLSSGIHCMLSNQGLYPHYTFGLSLGMLNQLHAD